jgi:uncharacterized protein
MPSKRSRTRPGSGHRIFIFLLILAGAIGAALYVRSRGWIGFPEERPLASDLEAVLARHGASSGRIRRTERRDPETGKQVHRWSASLSRAVDDRFRGDIEDVIARDGGRLSAFHVDPRQATGGFVIERSRESFRVDLRWRGAGSSASGSARPTRGGDEAISVAILPGARRAPRLALLVDDLGNDDAALRRLAGMAWPLTGAVLPALPRSAWSARTLRDSGKEVLLHLPMEPRDPGSRPGPGLVRTDMSAAEIVRVVETDLSDVPGAVGVNNHMGSKATANVRVMDTVLGVLRRRGLFFVDSRTTAATVAEQEARRLGVPAASRAVFLDDVLEPSAVEKQLEEAAERARRDGSAIAIGHPHPVTLGVLERVLPEIERSGVELVKVGEVVGEVKDRK